MRMMLLTAGLNTHRTGLLVAVVLVAVVAALAIRRRNSRRW
jgi:hypothetical protein